MSLLNNLRRFSTSLARKKNKKNKCNPKRTLPVLEALEDRQMLTTTVFLDFGDAFPTNGLRVRVSELHEGFNHGGIRGPDLEDGRPSLGPRQMLNFNSLQSFFSAQNYDYNGVGGVNNDDYIAFRNDVFNLVQRMFSPFDVNVRFGRASSLEDVREAMKDNNGQRSGDADAYVFVTPVFTSIGGTPTSVGALKGLFGKASDDDLNDILDNPVDNRNDLDETAVVFAENAWQGNNSSSVITLANVAAHEAGHTFGLPHVDGGDSELMTDGSSANWTQNRAFFSRYPYDWSEWPDELPDIIHINPWQRLKEDDDIGLRAGAPEFVTGTGGDDVIHITPKGSGAYVQVGRYNTHPSNQGFIPKYSYDISLANEVWIEAGRGNDSIVIDARLDANFHFVGGQGTDWISVEGNGAGSFTYSPDQGTQRTLDGMNAMTGIITAGAATITYDELEAASRIFATNFQTVTLETPNGADNLQIQGRGAWNDAPSDGDTDPDTYPRFEWYDVGRVVLDVGTRDTVPQTDFVDMEGIWPTWVGVRDSTPRPLTIRTGAGADRLAIAPDAEILKGFGDSSGLVRWEAGDDTDWIEISGYSEYWLSSSMLRFTTERIDRDGYRFTENVSVTLVDVEQAEITGTESGDTLRVESWRGDAYFNGRGGTDSIIFNNVTNATIRSATNAFQVNPSQVDEISVGSGSVQTANVENATLNDLRNRGNSITIDNDATATGSRLQSITVNTSFGSDTVDVIGSGADLTLKTGDGADTVIFNDARRSVSINTGGGDDTIDLGNEIRNIDFLPQITIDGGEPIPESDFDPVEDNDRDKLIVHDENNPYRFDYGYKYTVSEDSIKRRDRSASRFFDTELTFANIEALELSTGDRGDEVSIVGTPGDVVVKANGGEDTVMVKSVSPGGSLRVEDTGVEHFIIGQGDFFNDIRGNVTITGDGQTDLLIDDSSGEAINQEYYLIRDQSFSKNGVLELPGPNLPILSSTLTFHNMGSVTIEGSDRDNRFLVEGIATGTTLRLFGNGGDDEFRIGKSKGIPTQLEDILKGDVVIQGDGGRDSLYLNDQKSQADNQRYEFDEVIEDEMRFGTFKKNYDLALGGKGEGATMPWRTGELRYRSVGDITLDASPVDSTISVNDTPSGLTSKPLKLTLNGNGGNDTFEVAAAKLSGDLSVRGGGQRSSSGDSFVVTGTPGTTASQRSGRPIKVNGRSISFRELEDPVTVQSFDIFTVMTHLSHDDIKLAPTADNKLRISGTTTNVGMATMPITSFDIKNVRTVVVDTATNDAYVEPGPVNQPHPDDTITIEARALSTQGLETLRLLPGIGLGGNVVNDHALESGTPSNAVLEIIGVPPFVHHNIYGTAEQVQVQPEPGPLTHITASDAAGQTLYQIQNVLVQYITFVDPQNNVDVVTEDTALGLVEYNGRQRVSGSGMSVVDINADAKYGKLRVLSRGAHDSVAVIDAVFSQPLEIWRDVDTPGTMDLLANTRFAGNQANVRGFDGDDQLIFQELRSSGRVETLSKVSELIPDWRWLKVEQTEVNGNAPVTWAVEKTNGEFPSLLFESEGAVQHSVEYMPMLDPIDDQTMDNSQGSLTVQLSATDADGDVVSYSATVESEAYRLDQKNNFRSTGKYSLNWGGRSAKWINSDVGWHFLLPNGELYRWDGSHQKASGKLVASLDSAYYEDPSRLHDATAGATATVAGNVLTVIPDAGFVGTLYVRVSASDGALTDWTSFEIDVSKAQPQENEPPLLAPLKDQSMTTADEIFTINLSATDANGDALTYSASVESEAYRLDRDFNFKTSGNYSLNWGGRSEKWIKSDAGWHFLLPNGELYRWDGTNKAASGSLVASLHKSYYEDPSRLHDATPGADAHVAGDKLTVKLHKGFVGKLFATVTASDGALTDSTSFQIDVTEKATVKNQAPVLEAIQDQTMSASQGSLTVSLSAKDADGDAVTYSATVESEAYRLDQELNFRTTGNYSLNWGGRKEKWIQSDSGWHYLLPNGELYRWNGSKPIAGKLVAKLDSWYYQDPSRLHDASKGATAVIAGDKLTVKLQTGFVGKLFATVTASDGALSDSTSFHIDLTEKPAVKNEAPVLDAIKDQTMSTVQGSLTIALIAKDADGDAVTYSATVESEAYRLDQKFNFRTTGNYSFNWGGRKEKWIQSDVGWHFLLPNGEFYRWDGSKPIAGKLVAKLDSWYYQDPSRLHDATTGATAVVTGDKLTVKLNKGFVGKLFATVTASDGALTDSQSFQVTATQTILAA